jgi:hypothetical protein
MTEIPNSETLKEESKTTIKSGETSKIEAKTQEAKTLNTEGLSEIEKRIVARSTGGKVEATKKPETQETPEAKAEKERIEKERIAAENVQSKTQTATITEEDVKDFPALKTLVGKPYSELTKVYANLNKEFGRSQTELSELKRQKPAVEVQQITKPEVQKEEKTIEQQIDELIEKADLPDSFDDQKAYNKAFAKLQMKIADLKINAANKPIKDQFEAQRMVEEGRQQHDKAVSLIRESIGKDVDLDVLMNQFNESVQPVILEYPDYYKGKPELLASDISRFHLSNKMREINDELTATKTELEAAKAGKQSTVKEIKAKIEGAPDGAKKSSVVSKEKILTPAQEIENRIVKRHTGEDAY